MTKIQLRFATNIPSSQQRLSCISTTIKSPYTSSVSSCESRKSQSTLVHPALQPKPFAASTTAPSSAVLRRFLHHTRAVKMSSDADYAAFLDKANQETGAASAQKAQKVGTKSVNTAVPKTLESIEEYYISDADEPFEPVALKFEGDQAPSAEELKKLIGHEASVSRISEEDFDPRGQYKAVIDAVKKAGNGSVSIFKVEHGSTRAEYYVVSLDTEGGKLVGLKALAVES